MGGVAPVEVGARGTVASLVMKEIEYFRRMELDRPGGSSRKPPGHVAAEAESSRSANSRPSFSFPILTWRRWKKRRGSGILPSMCSAVEVADNGVPGFSYRNLKSDTEKYDDQF